MMPSSDKRDSAPWGQQPAFEDLLRFSEYAPDAFLAHLPRKGWRRPFGGHLLAQTVAAAARTAPPGWPLHVLQSQFLRVGDVARPIRYDVSRLRDGSRFSVRNVTASQDGRMLLVANLSYQQPETGLDHQHAMPEVPGPEGLRSEQQLRRDAMASYEGTWARSPAMPPFPIEMRPVQIRDYVSPPPQDRLDLWIRPIEPVQPANGPAFVACASDVMLLSTTLMPHALSWNTTAFEGSTLNHTLWLHDKLTDPSGWMLWSLESIWTGGTRGLARGHLWQRGGRLVASAMQEGLIRQI